MWKEFHYKTLGVDLNERASQVVLVVKNSSAIVGNARDSGLIPGRRKWQPTPKFLPGESHGQRSLVGYSPWGCRESDMTEHACN